MVGNFQGDVSGNILVEFDYNNIILVDPNKTFDSGTGRISERLVDHENLVMYANLEAQVLPRTKLALGTQPNENVSTMMTIAGINFLKPNKDNFMTSGYADELTGKNSLEGRGQNQQQERKKFDSQNRPYFQMGVVDQQSIVDNGLLGITSISVKTSTSFIPSVSMQLEDVQGRALFQLGDQSPYSAFFNLPYPQFYLTLKGYYGQAIRYQLNLEKFDARFNTSTGNYSISLEFRGFKFNILNEILISHLIATPHMYNKRFTVANDPAVANTSTNSRSLEKTTSGAQSGKVTPGQQSPVKTVTDYVTERGYEKIVEVYSEYKSKGLIPVDFPELTLMQFVYKMDMFEQNVINSYPKANVEPLTNIKNYQKTLSSLFEKVRGNSPVSWFASNIDPRPIILNGGTKIYFFKESFRRNPQARELALKQLEGYFETAIKTLGENPTLGVNRKLEIKLNNLEYSGLFYNQLNLYNIDEARTAESFQQVLVISNPEQVTKTKEEIATLILGKANFFIFEGVDRFDNVVKTIDAEASQKLSQVQQAITADLAAFIEDAATGIGFKPTVRNIVAVIMANAEGFIRLMEEVHTNAWGVRNNPVRKFIIQDTSKSATNTENLNVIKITTQAANQNQGINTAEEPVYPWPQFFIESPDDKKGRFQLEYLGHPSVVGLTQAYNFKIWPEVEFVEEYIKGLAQKDNPPSSQPPLDSQLTTYLTQINAIAFPPSNLSYLNKQEIRFFYEIWERQYVTSFYSNYIRVSDNQRNQLLDLNTSSESSNILLSLGTSNPLLSFNIKNRELNSTVYPAFLREISNNGTGPLWINFESGVFNTAYIKEETDNPYAIFSTRQLGLQPETSIPLKALEQMATESRNTPLIIDTYPFTDPTWVKNNMSQSNRSQGNDVFNTNKSLKVYRDRNVISNFTNLFDYNTNRPVTNFSYLDVVQPTLVNVTPGNENAELKNYYEGTLPKQFIPTMGYISNPLANTPYLPILQTTSILNTPYFINAIQNGVELEKQKKDYPYVQAAYLFLNSLPLGSLRERYKNLNQTEELDYVSSCFNKFGAIHKLPYAWILKIGAIWHRYKNYVENQVDILDNTVWTNFDYVKNYDPVSSSPTKVYEFDTANGTKEKIILQGSVNNTVLINTGFYPKVMNDFSYFYNGVNLLKDYSDAEFQKAINNKVEIFNFPNSNIQGREVNGNVSLRTWTVIVPSALKEITSATTNCAPPPPANQNQLPTKLEKFFIIPSFGINLNQSKSQCLSNPATNATNPPPPIIEPLSGNSSMYNGSVRTLWAAPNYGYFNASVLTKPNPDEYFNFIDPETSNQTPFRIDSTSIYSKIDEIFGVFDRKALNIMEKEFLEFSKPASSVKYQRVKSETGAFVIDLDTSLRNFQLFMRQNMEVEIEDKLERSKEDFLNIVEQQFGNFKNNIKNMMEYDVLIRNGNPSKYNRRTFNSFLRTPGFSRPIRFKEYVPGSLPTRGGTTTLSQSELAYPNEWETLRVEVGFSTIPDLVYSDNGSYITDFFVDNNIEFSVNNIVILSQIIKIYATQKLQTPSLSSTQFKNNLSTFLGDESQLQRELLDQVITFVKKEIKPLTVAQDQNINSTLSGTQGKAELYSLFRALNDKWIAGTDYVSKTLFEDFLFLDRASRNIGETIILDIFGVKNLINSESINKDMSVYTLISGLLMQNNFTVMPLPAYVNFYNVLNLDGTVTPNTESVQNFGNNLWGTFTSVDYRNAQPKMVCFYAGKPSEQLAISRQITGYGDDGFDLRNPNNPLVEDLRDKQDFQYSNKVVGFNVDIGIRNQNVFQNFSVSQDTGKATSETIAALLAMIDQTNTRNISTQNASLYNLYKRRSYQCDVQCLGNAMLQPTMYFNLRHVPMFYGPYMITEVSHNITAGDFTTSFKGVRQGYFDYPPIDNYIQKINQNLLSKIEAIVLQQNGQNNTLTTTQQQNANDIIVNTNQVKAAAEEACFSNRAAQFQTYITQTLQDTTITQRELVDAIKRQFGGNTGLETLTYILCYVRTYSIPGKEGGNFMAANNNFADITLDKPLPGNVVEKIEKNNYTCKEVSRADGTKAALPIARFESLPKFLEFMSALLLNRVSQILQGQTIQYYCTAFPSSNVSLDYYQQRQKEFEERYLPIFKQAVDSAAQQGFIVDFSLTELSVSGQTNNLNTTGVTPPVCPQTTVSNYTPTQGPVGTIITLSGTNLEYVRTILVGTTPVDPRTITFVDSTKLRFSIPNLVAQTSPTYIITVNALGNTNPIVLQPQFTFT